MTRDWVAFDGPLDGESKILKEVKKAGLTAEDSVRLDALLKRVARGQGIPEQDFKHLKERDLWEVRFRCAKRIFRMLYSDEGTHNVLVAVLFTVKKANKLSRQQFKTASQRLQAWRANNT